MGQPHILQATINMFLVPKMYFIYVLLNMYLLLYFGFIVYDNFEYNIRQKRVLVREVSKGRSQLSSAQTSH